LDGAARTCGGLFAGWLAIVPIGCGSPSAANTELRKQNQKLAAQVEQLKDQHLRDLSALAACERGHPTTATMTPEALDQLVTTHGLSIGRLTGGDNPDSTQTTDTLLKVYVVPTDGDGTPIKAAGAFRIEAFDLDDPSKPLVGSWKFDLPQVRGLFFSHFALYTYVLSCPWQTVPRHPDLTVRITFDDALTGREFVDQTQVKVRPPSSQP
jgi:hypothetical protein